jgi:Leucine-rich repeat (LRR) protein
VICVIATSLSACGRQHDGADQSGASTLEEKALLHFESTRRSYSVRAQYRDRWIALSGAITDADWEHLPNLVRLERLSLSSPHVTDMDLQRLQSMHRLESLDLYGCSNVVGPGLLHLKVVKNLKSLTLPKAFPEDALQYVAVLGNIESLRIYNASFSASAAGLQHLAQLPHLQELTLKSTDITDAGLAPIGNLRRLRSLELRNNRGITGNGLADLARLRHLESLDLTDTKVRDDGVAQLSRLANLQSLKLPTKGVTGVGFDDERGWVKLSMLRPGIDLTDDGLRYIGRIRSLKSLTLSGIAVSDDGLLHLTGLRNLEELIVSGTRITDWGMRHIGRLDGLKSLTVSGTRVTDDGLLHLGELRKLEVLTIPSKGITDAGLEHIKDLTELRSLNLQWTDTTDAGLAHLVELPKLEYLNVQHTRISDAGLEYVKEMKRLRRFDPIETRVSSRGREALLRARPDLDVNVDAPP